MVGGGGSGGGGRGEGGHYPLPAWHHEVKTLPQIKVRNAMHENIHGKAVYDDDKRQKLIYLCDSIMHTICHCT